MPYRNNNTQARGFIIGVLLGKGCIGAQLGKEYIGSQLGKEYIGALTSVRQTGISNKSSEPKR